MSTTEVRRNDPSEIVSITDVDMKVEVVVIPVSDVDRAKELYGRLGWRLDVTPPSVVQFTPRGSGCSVQFGATLTSAAPGSAKGYLIVSDIETARDDLVAAGAEVGDVYHNGPNGLFCEPSTTPSIAATARIASFDDPDGNVWQLQEITTRLPGRVDAAATSFGSASDLAEAMRRASVAHGDAREAHRAGRRNRPSWYAADMVAEQAGSELPTVSRL